MFDGYPIRTALTSLALLASLLGAAPAPAPTPRGCSDLRRFYAPRVLRELRVRLLLAYARAHERHARELMPAFKDEIRAESQESDDPRMKHLLAYVVTNCL